MKGRVDLSRHDAPRETFAEGDPESGPFASAVREGGTLTLARDAFGERPLLYCARGSEVWFASHAQDLRAMGAPLGQIDRGALSDYLELGYVPSPATMWSNVRKVLPGHRVRFPGGEAYPFAELPLPGTSPKKPSRIAVRARLEEAVKRALRGSQPAALVSSGLESAALVALLTRQAGRVRTFAVAVESDEEIEAARRIAHRFRSDHHEMRISLRPAEEVPKTLAACGEPFADAGLVLLCAALEAISRESSALLVSDGADELFAGHERYLRAARLPRMERTGKAAHLLRFVTPQRHRGRLQKAAQALQSAGAPRARALIEIFSAGERRVLLGGAARIAAYGPADEMVGADAALAFDRSIALPDSVLFRLEVAASLAGVRTRAAFCDPALERTVVPPAARFKLGRTRGNRLLREAVADLLPREMQLLPPRPLQAPVAAWLRGPLRAMLHDLVRSPSARIRTLLDPRAVDAALAHHPRQAWSLLALEIWARGQRG